MNPTHVVVMLLARAFPASVLRRILQFVPTLDEGDPSDPCDVILGDDVVPEAPYPIPKALQTKLRSLSPAYDALVSELVAAYRAQSRTLNFNSRHAARLSKVCETVEQAGAAVRCLSLCAGPARANRRFKFFDGIGDAASSNALAIDWTRIFAACPNLERLDLSNMPLHSPQLVDVLDAASRACKHVTALVLPRHERNRDVVDNTTRPLMKMLETAVERWYTLGVSTRLRQLRVPQRITLTDDLFSLSDRFLRCVTRYCPNLEYLDGYKSTFSSSDGLVCNDYLCCSPEVFRDFCRSCTKLRALNWFVLPYLDPFFEIFGEYPKPQLTKLLVAGGTHLEVCKIRDANMYKDHDYTFSSSGLAHLFAGCPALEELKFLFTTEEDTGGYDSDEDEGSSDRDRQSVVTDEVLLSIARNCTQLVSLTIEESEGCEASGPMMGITDVGVAALARLPRLESLRIKATHCGAHGIFALMEHAPERGGIPRLAVIDVMNVFDSYEPSGRDSRYELIVDLLELLVTNGDALRSRCFDVTIAVRWGPLTMEPAKVTALLKRVRSLHPTLAVALFEGHEPVDVDTLQGELTDVTSLEIASPQSAV